MRFLLISAALCLVSPALQAADSSGCTTPKLPYSADKAEIAFSQAFGCLGDATLDKVPMTTEINKQIPALKDLVPLDAAKVIHDIRKAYDRSIAALGAVPPEVSRARKKLDLRMDALSSLLDFGDRFPADLDDPVYWVFGEPPAGSSEPFGRLPSPTPRPDADGEELFLINLYAPTCTSGPTADCKAAIDASVITVRAVNLVQRTLAQLSSKALEALRTDSLLRRKKWQAYFGEALVQYPWEIAANGLLYDHGHRRSVLRDPPKRQLILFHPDAALEYVGGAPDGDAFKPAVLLEAVGGNFWSWDQDGSTKQALGASLGVLYADRAGVTDVGVALTFHILQKFTIGASVHSGDWGVFVNIPLADKVRSKYEDAKKTFSALSN